MSPLRRSLLPLVIAALVAAGAGCGTDDAAERDAKDAQEQLDKSAGKADEQVEDAADDAANEADEAAEDAEKAAEDATDGQ